ncbi:HAMP domain-containing protein, partial [Sulfuricurvum sp.]|uniref:HAMP domain-containing protein n=1 Tax=Sulfuricurvum sp. TaxID=2025608 RepID=UPI002D533BDF
MSIFTKITLLFSISLLLMIGIGYQIDTINTQKYELLILQKYIVDGRKIFSWMATSSTNELDTKLKSINLVKTAPVLPKRMLIRQPHTFGIFEIFESKSGDYVLHVRYIDDEIYLHDQSFQEAQKNGWVLNALVIADIAVLIIIFFSIVRMLSPLNSIASSMRNFAKGAYRSRSEVRSRDEIGEVARTYNEMAQTIENLILSRQELLR